MIAISIALAIDGWPIERILRERMWSRSRYATTTVGELQSAGYELVVTSSAPLDYADALRRSRLLLT